MKPSYNAPQPTLEAELPDVGYSAEKVLLLTKENKNVTVGGHTNRAQLLLSYPLIDDAVLRELADIEGMLGEPARGLIDAWVITAEGKLPEQPGFFRFGVDVRGEFGDDYGRLADGPYAGKLPKGLFIIAPDGTLMHVDVPGVLAAPFRRERFVQMIGAALSCCDKKGCH